MHPDKNTYEHGANTILLDVVQPLVAALADYKEVFSQVLQWDKTMVGHEAGLWLSHRLLADLQANIIPVKGLAPGLFNTLEAVVNKIGSAPLSAIIAPNAWIAFVSGGIRQSTSAGTN